MNKYNLSQSEQKKGPTIEVEAKRTKLQRSVKYKRKILDEASKLTKAGDLGALLRREGLSSSTFYGWRVAEANGKLKSSTARRRGPKPQLDEGQRSRLRKLEREVLILKKRAERAEAIVDLQKKIAEVMRSTMGENEESKS